MDKAKRQNLVDRLLFIENEINKRLGPLHNLQSKTTSNDFDDCDDIEKKLAELEKKLAILVKKENIKATVFSAIFGIAGISATAVAYFFS